MTAVALRKESVDRNSPGMNIILFIIVSLSARRAWIEIDTGTYHPHFHVSLSARRAWIEILGSRIYDMSAAWSLSARRAWIEMVALCLLSVLLLVALRKESVDRNIVSVICLNCSSSRSPQGERG